MPILADAYRNIVKVGHTIGLDRISLARKIVDVGKRFVGDTEVPWPVRIQGFYFKGISIADYLNGSYEPETTALFKRVIKPGMVALDIGAQLGYFTLLLSKLVGEHGKAYAFEPFAEMYAKLRNNIARNRATDNIVTVSKGASDAARAETYYIPSASMFAVKKEDMKPDQKGLTARIECLPLDEYFAGKLSPIDFIKIDIEGAEQLALKGMEDILTTNPNIQMVIEVAPKVLDKIGKKPEALLVQLRGYGFRPAFIDADGSTRLAEDREIIARARAERYINIYCERN